MGKNIITQARGKGGPTYRASSFKYRGEPKHKKLSVALVKGCVTDIIHCAGHYAPLMKVMYEDGEETLTFAPESIAVGDFVHTGDGAELKIGNTMPLKSFPDGSEIHNIEITPGDGGKFARSSGVAGKIIGKISGKVIVELPSKKQKMFSEFCRASSGVLAGGGRLEKPIMKAGNAHHKARARNKLYPHITGSAQNAVDHPFGNKRSSRKSKARPISRNAPPGRKVGYLASRRTGRKTKGAKI